MALYKDLNGGIHDDMDGEATHMLPDGCTPITLSEADALRAAERASQYAALPYQQKRAPLYPPLANLADAQVKMRHPDPAVQAEGRRQLELYDAACWLVKESIPKA